MVDETTHEMQRGTTNLLTGMTGFSIVWVGQFVSMLGTSMTNFALTIWAWELTGEATALALVGFFFVAPYILVSPVAGALVDRSNRARARPKEPPGPPAHLLRRELYCEH